MEPNLRNVCKADTQGLCGTGRRNELLGRRFCDCASPRHSNLGVAPRYRRSRLVANRARDRASHSTGRNRTTMRTEAECRDWATPSILRGRCAILAVLLGRTNQTYG